MEALSYHFRAERPRLRVDLFIDDLKTNKTLFTTEYRFGTPQGQDVFTHVKGSCKKETSNVPFRKICIRDNHRRQTHLTIGGSLRATLFRYDSETRQSDLLVSHPSSPFGCIPINGAFFDHQNGRYSFDADIRFSNSVTNVKEANVRVKGVSVALVIKESSVDWDATIRTAWVADEEVRLSSFRVITEEGCSEGTSNCQVSLTSVVISDADFAERDIDCFLFAGSFDVCENFLSFSGSEAIFSGEQSLVRLEVINEEVNTESWAFRTEIVAESFNSTEFLDMVVNVGISFPFIRSATLVVLRVASSNEEK